MLADLRSERAAIEEAIVVLAIGGWPWQATRAPAGLDDSDQEAWSAAREQE